MISDIPYTKTSGDITLIIYQSTWEGHWSCRVEKDGLPVGLRGSGSFNYVVKLGEKEFDKWVSTVNSVYTEQAGEDRTALEDGKRGLVYGGKQADEQRST
jgi:hypothetical protein